MEHRKIIHIDMDAFYASVEQRDNPEYRGKAVAVGHPGKRGIVAAASYEARRYGIHSAMSSEVAVRLCPDLIFIPSHMETYQRVSGEIRAIFNEYTDLIEPLSIDEAFLDVTENKKNIPLAIDVARAIKQEIKERLNLTASAGVSYNKFLAKIASDYKKPDGLYTIHPEKALEFIEQLPIESFWGIGKVTANTMHALGIHNGKQLRTCSLEFLIRNFGKNGALYHNFSRGIDTRAVETLRIRKSVGCEYTFEKDLYARMSIIIELNHIVAELYNRLSKTGFKGRTLTLKIKFNDFSVKTHSISSEHPLVEKKEILILSKKMLEEINLKNKKIRLMGVSISNPMNDKEGIDFPLQLSFDFK
ncbi:DNA polymerase IV [Porphyromonadaceae bacterium OttesenSCG-928-L07]|nr:DNA polymerase IV [Porphyromonadaceae bacterium OttesenSCG-928-L07]